MKVTEVKTPTRPLHADMIVYNEWVDIPFPGTVMKRGIGLSLAKKGKGSIGIQQKL